MKYIMLFIGLLFLLPISYALVDWQTNRMNFAPGTVSSHYQTINVTSIGYNITATIPSGFVVTDNGSANQSSGTNLTWINWRSTRVNYTMNSSNTAVHGNVFYSKIYINNSYKNQFVFAALDNNKIIDTKMEYGRGDWNYLNTNYIGNESQTLYMLIRVWNIGGYLSPNENGLNAKINCTFPLYHTPTHMAELVYNTDNILAQISWDNLYESEMFRIAAISQDLRNLTVSLNYTVNCTNLTYSFTHEQVIVPNPGINLEVRNIYPFDISHSNDTVQKRVVYNITNVEKYTARDVKLDWSMGNSHIRRDIGNLIANETAVWEVYATGNGTITLNIEYLTPWYEESVKSSMRKYTQTDSYFYKVDTGTNELNSVEELIYSRNVTAVESSKFYSYLTATSPIYRSEQVIIEAVFKDGIGASVAPDTINMTIYDPNGAVFAEAVKNNFTQLTDNVWKYNLTSTNSSPITGRYRVHMISTYGVLTSYAAPVHFRVATGGPYSARIEITNINNDICRGSTMSTTTTLIDEGEVPTETSCSIWLDSDGDGVKDAGEPQSSFSKETIPLQNTTVASSITIPASHTLGTFTVNLECEYIGSSQPPATASDTAVISLCISSEPTSPGGYPTKEGYPKEWFPQGEAINFEVQPKSFKLVLVPGEIQEHSFNIYNYETFDLSIQILSDLKLIGESLFNLPAAQQRVIQFKTEGKISGVVDIRKINVIARVGARTDKETVDVELKTTNKKQNYFPCRSDADCLSDNCLVTELKKQECRPEIEKPTLFEMIGNGRLKGAIGGFPPELIIFILFILALLLILIGFLLKKKEKEYYITLEEFYNKKNGKIL